MQRARYLTELENCQLCEWHCGVNRLVGEVGMCQLGLPQVASRALHPAPPSSYTLFMAGCNFKCLHCQNWDIAHWPHSGAVIDGWVDPADLARESITALNSLQASLIRADRLFFSGGCPTCSLPYIEEVVARARALQPGTLVNFDTNGFMTPDSLARVLEFADSITYDIRAVSDDVHRALTGAPAAPMLRNAEVLAAHREKLWEFRVLIVPRINEGELEAICRFLAGLDAALPVCFLAFRPNFVLENHPGASLDLMRQALAIARDCGLTNADWAGRPGLPGRAGSSSHDGLLGCGVAVAQWYARRAGCQTIPRDCGTCPQTNDCPVKQYQPLRRT